MDTLPRRQLEVLQATVRHYVDTMEPVGSNTLVRRFGLPASPATVRSAMGALEQRGLLTQPHVSAGRIPSERGYRTYVDQLLPAPGSAALQLERELTGLSLQWMSLDDLLRHLGRRLADLTGLLSLITRPQRPQPQLQAIRLIPSHDRLLVFLVQGPALSSSLNVRLPGIWSRSCRCWSAGPTNSSAAMARRASPGSSCPVNCSAVATCCGTRWPAMPLAGAPRRSRRWPPAWGD